MTIAHGGKFQIKHWRWNSTGRTAATITIDGLSSEEIEKTLGPHFDNAGMTKRSATEEGLIYGLPPDAQAVSEAQLIAHGASAYAAYVYSLENAPVGA